MNNENYKDQIIYLITKLWTLGILLGLFLTAEVLISLKEYKLSRIILPAEPGVNLSQEKFNQLWKDLNQRVIPVELDQEIRYVETRGKLEPFE